MFVAPQRAERARHAIVAAMGGMKFELLTAFLAFVRTAHYWTETHPSLEFEADMIAIMNQHPELATLMLDGSDAQWAQSSEALRRALVDLRNTAGTLRATEDRFRAFVTATSNILFRMSPDWREMWHLEGRGFIVDTASPSGDWLNEYIHPDDRHHLSAVIAEAVKNKVCSSSSIAYGLSTARGRGPFLAQCRCWTIWAKSPSGLAPRVT